MVGLKCTDCDGKGYTVSTRLVDGRLEPVKIWCETCEGTGRITYKGDRTGIAWEGE